MAVPSLNCCYTAIKPLREEVVRPISLTNSRCDGYSEKGCMNHFCNLACWSFRKAFAMLITKSKVKVQRKAQPKCLTDMSGHRKGH